MRLRHLLWKTSISFSSLLFISCVSQPRLKTGLSRALYHEPDFGSLVDAVGATDLPQSHKYPSGFDYSTEDVSCASTFLGN